MISRSIRVGKPGPVTSPQRSAREATPAGRRLLLGSAALGCLVAGYTLGYRAAPQTGLLETTSTTAHATPAILPTSTSPASEISEGASPSPAEFALARWKALRDQPATPGTEEQLCATVQTLAATDHDAALQLAATAATPRLRELFRNAALHGWATRDPQAAAAWVMKQVRYEERRAAVEAIAAGAVAQPGEARRAFDFLITADPLWANDHGSALVTALARAGQFELASQFAASGPAAHRSAWLSTTFQAWAVCQPQAALAAVGNIADAASREVALGGLFAGWGSSDPAALVAYADTLPRSDTRTEALKNGLTQWVYRDPVAASAWMDRLDPSPDLDAGAAAVAVAPALVANKPEIAASWAESITDPDLRANTLLELFRQWAERDAGGALNYVQHSSTLPPEMRSLALSFLKPTP